MGNSNQELIELLKSIQKSFTRLTVEIIELNERIDCIEDFIANNDGGYDDETRISNPYGREIKPAS